MAEKLMWKMRGGEKIAIIDMDDDHLINAIHLCERRATMIAKRVEEEINRFETFEDPSAYYQVPFCSYLPKSYKYLVAMAKARGLDYKKKQKERTHFAISDIEGICKTLFVKTTTVVEKVTCPQCLALLKKKEESPS